MTNIDTCQQFETPTGEFEEKDDGTRVELFAIPFFRTLKHTSAFQQVVKSCQRHAKKEHGLHNGIDLGLLHEKLRRMIGEYRKKTGKLIRKSPALFFEVAGNLVCFDSAN